MLHPDTVLLQRALADIWEELPALVGSDWHAVGPKLFDLREQLRLADDPDQETLLRYLVIIALRPYPSATQRLVERQEQLRQRSALPDLDYGIRSAEPQPKGIQPVASPVTRYTDIACPRRVWIDAPRVTVVVRLTVALPASSAAVQALTLEPDQPVWVRLKAPGFIMLNPPIQTMDIPANSDSSPIVFDLRPEHTGHTTLTFDFYQGGQPAGTATVPVEITDFEVIEGAEPRPESKVAFQPGLAAPDLVLHIAVEGSSLVFSLLRDGGAWWRTFPPVPLEQPPAAYAATLYGAIASLVDAEDPAVQTVLGKRLRIPAEEVERRIKKLGQNLWKLLIPDELKALYAAERDAWAGKTLFVQSDEPYLPWELVWPFDAHGQWQDDAPWCSTLLMTRWLRKDGRGNGNETPPGALSLRRLAVLAPTYSLLTNLAGAQREQQALLELAVSYGLHNVGPGEPTWSRVLDLLESRGYDWIHAAAHGNFYAAAPDADSALWLASDRALTPDAIVGPEIEGHLAKARPGFFFNACQVGRQGWTLTRMGGWANRLVSAGAGLFIGPLWEVKDKSALAFANTFYATLLAGETVARAAHQARQAARAAGDPTWLAYSVYAHPNARVR